uniref:NR LBD domain-containing protein n=1 Tax=Anopheles maculatus TaxID=74869 RepID=A0A182TBI7_9DIPT
MCDVQPVEMLQDQAQCVLSEHVRVRYPRQPTRFGRLLLLLPLLRTIRSTTIETLFFKETIGTVPISRLLIDMYQMEKYTDLEGGTGGTPTAKRCHNAQSINLSRSRSSLLTALRRFAGILLVLFNLPKTSRK